MQSSSSETCIARSTIPLETLKRKDVGEGPRTSWSSIQVRTVGRWESLPDVQCRRVARQRSEIPTLELKSDSNCSHQLQTPSSHDPYVAPRSVWRESTFDCLHHHSFLARTIRRNRQYQDTYNWLLELLARFERHAENKVELDRVLGLTITRKNLVRSGPPSCQYSSA